MDISALTAIDYIFITIMFLSTVWGCWRGVVKSILSLIRMIVAVILTYQFAPTTQILLKPYVAEGHLLDFTSVTLAFVISFLFLTIVNFYLLSLLQNARGGAVDKTLGASFGFARGCLLVCLIFIGVVYAMVKEKTKVPGMTNQMVVESWLRNDADHPDILRNAESYSLVKNGSLMLVGMLPAQWLDKVDIGSETPDTPAGVTILNQDHILEQLLDALPEDPAMRSSLHQALSSFNSISPAEQQKLVETLYQYYQQSVSQGTVTPENQLNPQQLQYIKQLMSGGTSSATPPPAS